MASDSPSRRYLWETRLLFVNPVLRRVYAMSTGVIIVLGARQALVKINKLILANPYLHHFGEEFSEQNKVNYACLT